ncbi:multi-component transcriptional regulator [Nostoc sp. 'Peltigera membranacea cyanobiont' 210A]|uniref:response regulator n=1 Tax=Nostoc sp. 'Peltigera membranacea cyanobiont' 210A TaxID=2014529 RepID=UPI000B951C7F|nr:response regulator [Nostoc sp. 'Peltigera membranacea cyanobiont' 210A]OYD90002.1 multi-component transcriptional regulator [Nostoc sp. 'Peltigera membranacea cyanobiont' 210A]
MKILLVEDDVLLSTALFELLSANRYTIDIASNGQAGLELALSTEYELILLDWLIPKLDGITLCRQLRKQGYRKSILLLTGKNSNADIVAGLDAGADDYVIKPFNPEALLARIRSLLRRNEAISSSTLTWGNLCLDPSAGRVTCNEQEIPLTAKEYKLLELFLQNPDRIFSRAVIIDRLWGFDDTPTENAVTTHIKDLRKKLKTVGLAEDFLETVYGMGYRIKPAPNRSISVGETNQDGKKKPGPKDMTSVNRVLERFRNSFAAQVVVLDRAKTALLAGNLNEELHQQALREAHKLAGSMGSFGYPEGSRLARKIEHLLLGDFSLSPDQISNFSQLVTALQQELTKPAVTSTPQNFSVNQTYRLLVIDDDMTLTEQLQAEADSWGMRMKVAPNLATARSLFSLKTPDVVLLDLSFPTTEEDGLILLSEIVQRSPNIPVIVFTGRDTLADRLAVSRLGARQFLHKPATTEQIFQAIARVLPQPQTSEAKVLIVDDDHVILAGLSALLTPWGLEVTTLSQSQQFWQVLIATSPDLVVLDLEMPIVNGLELCQVVRQDAQWGDLPILVVTAHTEAEFLQQAFAAGADDFISKPVLGPELVTRVLSRIQRTRRRSQLGRGQA